LSGVLVFFILQSLLADYGSWYLMILGIIGIIIMLFSHPKGLWGLIQAAQALSFSRAPPSDRRRARHTSSKTQTDRRKPPMADITTDVLIIGTGPAGSATAALLSSYGIENMAINRYRWLADTPRAHITNQRTMEVLRDLGQRGRGRGLHVRHASNS
jgi:hypothetical protein